MVRPNNHLLKLYAIQRFKTHRARFQESQGNINYIPPLQGRLDGDVAILKTGTFGIPGDLKLMVERCEPSCGVLTNITSDHLENRHDFVNYAQNIP
ncbi:Mur ligase family protein [Methanobacterium paludis]|uniref:Mur ligase family protein n=1 Tax=Methanobacterium paludis (strain DSM 25820 / JCM 18151 / SWAN1) TaxID=868131 RepID=UPI00064FE468|nr:Mur ligase family protein [Methanobacterium paludis]